MSITHPLVNEVVISVTVVLTAALGCDESGGPESCECKKKQVYML